MPQVIPIAVAALTTAAAAAATIPIIGTVVAASLTATAVAVSYGGVAGFLALGKFALNVATIASLFSTSSPRVGQAGRTLDFTADPYAGLPYIMGETGCGGVAVAQRTSGGTGDLTHKWLHNFVVLSAAGPIDSFTSFTADDEDITYNGSGLETGGAFANVMWSARTLGPYSSWSIGHPTGTGTVSDWTSAHKCSGYAMDRWILKSDANKYANGVPKPIWKIKGVKCYDPRLDSTQTAIGGSGSHRWADPQTDPEGHLAAKATWAWTDNPAIHRLNWCLGRWDRDEAELSPPADYRKILGLGAALDDIDLAAHAEWADVCDTNAWTLNGGVTSKDAIAESDRAMCQAGGGVPIRKDGKLSVLIQQPRVSIATLTAADVAGKITITGTPPVRSKKNLIIPRYPSEDHKWEPVDAEAVSVADYITADGVTRSTGVTYPLVTDVDQVSQLATYAIYDSYEFAAVIPLMPRWQGLAVGDCITLDDPDLGFSSAQEFVILAKDTDINTGLDVISCRTETSGKHAAALGTTGTAPPVPTVTGNDLRAPAAPLVSQWAIESTTETVGDYTNPLVRVTGSADDNPAASNVIFRYSHDGSTGLIGISEDARSVTESRVPYPLSGETYYIHVSYRVMGVESEALVLGPVVAAASVVGGTGGAEIGDTVFDSSVPGTWEWLASFTGDATVRVYGGGGSPGDDYLDPKDGVTIVYPAGDGGDGGYSEEVIAVTYGVTLLNGDIGGGGTIDITGGESTCADTGQSALGGDPGTADEYGTYNGADGTASGGTTNTTGAGSAGGASPGGLGANGRIWITRDT